MNNRGLPCLKVVIILLLTILVSSCSSNSRAENHITPSPAPQVLSLEILLGNSTLEMPLPTTEFAQPASTTPPAQNFSGRLSLDTKGKSHKIETIVDTYSVVSEAQLRLTEFPFFSYEFVGDGSAIIPVQREPQRGSHPYWELILEPGKTWTNPTDKGWSRVSLPFALKEKNQNCTHNGLLTFLFKPDGSTSRALWQVASETCLYLKVNMWGVADVKYTPGTVPASGSVIAAHRKEIASRLPVKPLGAIEADYPGVDQSAFEPAGVEDASVYGFVVNGTHYRSECQTRYGPYPFCDVMNLPSYSLAKSIFAGLAYLVLSKQWPEFKSTPVSSLIPECKLSDGRWDNITPANLINMNTGNYQSSVFNADEDNGMAAFFVAETHQEKLEFSCEAWPGRSAGGTQWVYHTTDTYLLGVAMNNFLKQKKGNEADIYTDLLYPQLLGTLNPSPPLHWTQRTYDDALQAFTGYGLILHSDDLARIAVALNTDNDFSRQLAGVDFDAAMFRSDTTPMTIPGSNGLAYSTGFWGVDASTWITCSNPTWIPFMSGFGGIAVVLLPNGSVYYFFTDSNQHTFRKAATEANKALNYCKE